MGRKPWKHLTIPSGVRIRKRGKKTFYYYDTGGKERKLIALGSDYLQALRKYAELDRTDPPVQLAQVTVAWIIHEYLRLELPKSPLSTQRDYGRCARKVLEFFDNPPALCTAVETFHVQRYMDQRNARVRANREISFLSIVWNWAKRRNYVTKPNPTLGAQRNEETGRDLYVDNVVFDYLLKCADASLNEVIEFLYLTRQRPSDCRRALETQIIGEELVMEISKTRRRGVKRLRFRVKGKLAELLARIRERKRTLKVHSLHVLVDEQGQPWHKTRLERRFQQLRESAAAMAALEHQPGLAIRLRAVQMRDLRPKGATDDLEAGKTLIDVRDGLGHTKITTTEKYLRNRKGRAVDPTGS